MHLANFSILKPQINGVLLLLLSCYHMSHIVEASEFNFQLTPSMPHDAPLIL